MSVTLLVRFELFQVVILSMKLQDWAPLCASSTQELTWSCLACFRVCKLISQKSDCYYKRIDAHCKYVKTACGVFFRLFSEHFLLSVKH